MKVWTVVGHLDGNSFASVHLTRKGAFAEAIEECWDILGASPDTTFHDEFGGTCFYGTHEELMKLSSDQLKDIHRAWQEPMYMYEAGLYMNEVLATNVKP